jgi:anti-sigma regulatory factor (Ser/Thr protein kinase)
MELPAKAENLALFRAGASSRAAELGMPAAAVEDLKTVVSEACANVVNYAYDPEVEGPLELELLADAKVLTIFVRDRGGGIRPRPETDLPSLKLGLPIIGALSRCFELSSEAGRGTQLRIVMAISPADR